MLTLARTALEVVSWLGLASVIGFGMVWVVGWMSGAARMGDPEGTTLAIMGVLAAVMALAVWVVPWAVIIKVLRGETVRAAVSRR